MSSRLGVNPVDILPLLRWIQQTHNPPDSLYYRYFVNCEGSCNIAGLCTSTRITKPHPKRCLQSRLETDRGGSSVGVRGPRSRWSVESVTESGGRPPPGTPMGTSPSSQHGKETLVVQEIGHLTGGKRWLGLHQTEARIREQRKKRKVLKDRDVDESCTPKLKFE